MRQPLSDLANILPKIMDSLGETLGKTILKSNRIQSENQNELVNSQNIERWKLPPGHGFDPKKPRTLVLFFRHVTDRIMNDIKLPCYFTEFEWGIERTSEFFSNFFW